MIDFSSTSGDNNGTNTPRQDTPQDASSTISFGQEGKKTRKDETFPVIDFGPVEDKTHGLIKVVGVGGGGCNAVRNMYNEGIVDVNFAVCNTDSKSLSKSPVPVKLPIGNLGAGGDPDEGRKAAQSHLEEIKRLFTDGTKMVFVTAGMGGGTGTGAAPVVAGVAKSMGLLTIGIVTIPFFFEKRRKIVKALKGVEEMRKNVDAILIVNNERICDIYADSDITVKESFRRADQILCNATKSISELITIEGDINLDFKDVESTMRSGGGAIMAMGRASGERRVEKAIIDALDSPLLYGNDISKAKRILFNIYTSEKQPLHVKEMNEIDAFMDALNPEIEVIWGVSDDNTLDEDAKVTILATGFDDGFESQQFASQSRAHEDEYYSALIAKLYKPLKKDNWTFISHPSPQVEPDRSFDNPPSEAVSDHTASVSDSPVAGSAIDSPASEVSSSVSDNPASEASAPVSNSLASEASSSVSDNPVSDIHRDNSVSGRVVDNPTSNVYGDASSSYTTEQAERGQTHSSSSREEGQAVQPKKERGMSWLDRLKKKIEDMGLVDDMNNPSE